MKLVKNKKMLDKVDLAGTRYRSHFTKAPWLQKPKSNIYRDKTPVFQPV